ncbi:hypothetical protein AV521_03145 [Streptomyces sp. IMTB 2501]|uniref:DUF4232 domain-containing protein n=1 Tax=Streptomyces sp. IMTB 2501 TaxID=1776340 RepID=UPI00096DE0A6|nr:DUF4232 domain-containing protein [Streptomyces sp. IMTB 2501]OLZ74625.1 hypothetical protein AV521_03145 [Streptomyces sp. IMTB 2501]
MQHRNTIRLAASATAVIAAALSLTACNPGDDAGAAKTSSPASTTPTHAAPGTASRTPTAPSASRASGGTSTTPGAPASPISGTAAGTKPTCPVSAVNATAYRAANRPDGTGTGAAIVEFTNVSGHACVLRGHPSVAGAGNGSPAHNSPLKVTPTGTAKAVPLAPGGKAWVKLTFHQVQGEADGYCVSGAKPVVYPTLVIGLPGSGQHQVALSDGEFAECDNIVTATAVSAAKPS